MCVLSCNRKDCENIMCNIYVPNVGYICNECVKEFKEFQDINDVKFEGEIKVELEKFMSTNKDNVVLGNKISVDDFFNKNTRIKLND